MSKRLFISKPFEELTLKFVGAAKLKGFELDAATFLEFERLTFEIENDFDVVFFSSPRSANYFLREIALTDDIKIAAVGSETAKTVQEFGYIVDFTGEKSGFPTENADKFKAWCRERKVLFPVSDASLLSYSKVFPQNQVQIVSVYKTKIIPTKVKDADVYAFTSPSNVQGFFQLNNLPSGVKVIAWGKSTDSELSKHGVKSDIILETSSLEELLEKL